MAAAGPGAAALAAGMVGISRTAGRAAQRANGGGVTPILGIPYQISMPGMATASSGAGPSLSDGVKGQCHAAYHEELDECYDAFDLPRGSRNPGNRNIQQCIENANDRYFECLRTGEPYSSNIPLFRNVKLPRKR